MATIILEVDYKQLDIHNRSVLKLSFVKQKAIDSHSHDPNFFQCSSEKHCHLNLSQITSVFSYHFASWIHSYFGSS